MMRCLALLCVGVTILGCCLAQTDECRTSIGINGRERDTRVFSVPCLTGTYQWNYPEGTVKFIFPIRLLPASSRRRCMRIRACISGDMELLTAFDSTYPVDRPLTPEVESEESDESEDGRSWNCTLYGRRGVGIKLVGPDLRERYANMIMYKMETTDRCRGGRRPRPGRRGRPDRHGNRNPNSGLEVESVDAAGALDVEETHGTDSDETNVDNIPPRGKERRQWRIRQRQQRRRNRYGDMSEDSVDDDVDGPDERAGDASSPGRGRWPERRRPGHRRHRQRNGGNQDDTDSSEASELIQK